VLYYRALLIIYQFLYYFDSIECASTISCSWACRGSLFFRWSSSLKVFIWRFRRRFKY